MRTRAPRSSGSSEPTSIPGGGSVRRAAIIAVCAVGVIGIGATLAAIPPALAAIEEIRRGATGLEQTLHALKDERTVDARENATASAEAFSRAREHLGSAWMWGARMVPISSQHIRLGSSLARAGGDAARAGSFASAVLDARGDSFDLDAFARAVGPQREVVLSLHDARERMDEAPRTLVLGRLASYRALVSARLRRAETNALQALAGLEAGPRLLGADRPRRYLVLLADPAETRGTAGVWRAYAVVTAEGGRLAVEEDSSGDPMSLSRPSGTDAPDWYQAAYGSSPSWRDVNATADFTAAAEIARDAASETLGPLDGVVQLTPSGLEALSGDALTESFDPADLESALEQAFTSFVAPSVGRSRAVARAVRAGHIQIHAPDETKDLLTLGVSGSPARASSATELLGIVTSNTAGDRLDSNLDREISYEVSLDPRRSTTTGTVTYAMRNTDEATRQTIVLLRSPGSDSPAITVDGRSVQPTRDHEAGLVGYHTEVLVGLGATTRLRAELSQAGAMTGSGRTRTYRLHLFTQALEEPPPVEIEIDTPPGWAVRGDARLDRDEVGDVVLEVELAQPLTSWLTDVFVSRPWRALRGLF